MKRANGTGSIAKLSGKRRKPFVATVTKGWELDGDKHRQIRVTLGYYETRKAAREALDAYLQAPIERPRITLKELYDEWSAVKYRNITSYTKSNYEYAWRRMEALYGIPAKELRTAQMQKIIDDNIEMSRSSLEKIKLLFHLLMDYAVQNDVTHKNYASFIALPKKAGKERGAFTDLEIQTLFKNDDDKWVKSILILIYTGFRISEFLSLTRFNVDLKNGIIIGGSKSEAGRNRIVPISDKILEYVKWWISQNGDVLICTPRGDAMSPQNYRNSYYNKTLARLGIRQLSPHCCRHTFATMLSRVGADTVAIQKIIGHSNYATTANIYTHPDFKMLKDAIRKLK